MSTSGANPLIPAAIPPFSGSGVLPPFVGPDPIQIAGVSPYETTLSELATRFGTSPERRDILRGFLAHRQELLARGINGVQWIDGSFVEDVETTRGVPPKDLDVVTFFVRPATLRDPVSWQNFVQANDAILKPSVAKAQFKVDPYFVDVFFGPLHVIEQAAYWYGLFSHQRVSSLWKGLLKVWLDSQRDDANALQILNGA